MGVVGDANNRLAVQKANKFKMLQIRFITKKSRELSFENTDKCRVHAELVVQSYGKCRGRIINSDLNDHRYSTRYTTTTQPGWPRLADPEPSAWSPVRSSAANRRSERGKLGLGIAHRPRATPRLTVLATHSIARLYRAQPSLSCRSGWRLTAAMAGRVRQD